MQIDSFYELKSYLYILKEFLPCWARKYIFTFKNANYGLIISMIYLRISFNLWSHFYFDFFWSIIWQILVISAGIKMERKSSFRMSSDFCYSKITEVFLEVITVRGIIGTCFLIKIWNLWSNPRQQVRNRHYLLKTPLIRWLLHVMRQVKMFLIEYQK